MMPHRLSSVHSRHNRLDTASTEPQVVNIENETPDVEQVAHGALPAPISHDDEDVAAEGCQVKEKDAAAPRGAAVTGEEKELAGSNYHYDHNEVAPKPLVAILAQATPRQGEERSRSETLEPKHLQEGLVPPPAVQRK